jgi:hypothetical protein
LPLVTCHPHPTSSEVSPSWLGLGAPREIHWYYQSSLLILLVEPVLPVVIGPLQLHTYGSLIQPCTASASCCHACGANALASRCTPIGVHPHMNGQRVDMQCNMNFDRLGESQQINPCLPPISFRHHVTCHMMFTCIT